MPSEQHQWRALAARLRPLMVKLYADSRGWEAIRLDDARFWLLRHPEQRLRQLQIPMDADDPGYTDAMLEVLRRLSQVEARPLESVYSDLLSANADTLRVRVAGPEAEAGLFPFAADVALREGMRRVLLASACSVVRPARFHPRLSRSEADELLAACRAGQTERGSYVLKVICPLHAVDVPDGEEPFTRRVTRYLMEATHRLVFNIERGDFDDYEREPDEAERAGQALLSANLCEALLRMKPEHEDTRVEFSTRWATDRRVSPPEGVPQKVVIKSDYFDEIEEIARVLRPVTATRREVSLVATVEQLAGEVGPENQRSGEVTFNVFGEDENFRARARLDARQYAVALAAHEQGNAYVALRGELRRGRRLSRIEPLHAIQRLGNLAPSASD